MNKILPVFAVGLLLTACGAKDEPTAVSSFEECVEQTGIVMESYPRQCRDESGTLWVEEIESQTTSEKDVAYHPEKPELKGYLAVPEGEGPFPALILIHEWWGLNDNIRDFAERFADQGYVALAVDLYDGELAETRERAGELAGSVRGDTEPAFANLRYAVEFLSNRTDVDAKSLASVGWCFGGGWAYQMAKNDLGVEASIMYYGHFDAEADFQHMRTTILGHFGETDRSISVDDVDTFRANLATASGDHAVYIYPNAGHAFANEDSDNYDVQAAELSWERTLDFLEEEL